MTDAQSKGIVTAEHLHGVIEVTEPVGRNIIVCKCQTGDFSAIDRLLQMGVGNDQQLQAFRP